MKIKFAIALFAFAGIVPRSYGQAGPTNSFNYVYLSEQIAFKSCRLSGQFDSKTSVLDTTGVNPDAIYGRVGKAIICIHNCGSIYVFKPFSATSSFRPTYYVNTCYGQFDLAQQAIAVNKEYVFILANQDTYLSKPSVKLLLVNLNNAKVKVIDKGKIDSNLHYFANATTLFYTKNGKEIHYSLLRKTPEKVGF